MFLVCLCPPRTSSKVTSTVILRSLQISKRLCYLLQHKTTTKFLQHSQVIVCHSLHVQSQTEIIKTFILKVQIFVFCIRWVQKKLILSYFLIFSSKSLLCSCTEEKPRHLVSAKISILSECDLEQQLCFSCQL